MPTGAARTGRRERGLLMEHETGDPMPGLADVADLPAAADGAGPDRVPEMLDMFEQEEMPDPADAVEADGADEVSEPETRSAERRQETGEPRVDDALHRLDDLTELPVSDHLAVFEHVHARLSEVLGELDAGTPTGAQGRQGS
jgi:hypothetical protein